MKKMKKIVSIMLAMVMVFAISVPAIATDLTHEYTITVQKSTEGKTYSAYKIFDATYQTVTSYDEDTETTSEVTYVSYTISEGDAWYDLVQTDEEGLSGYSIFLDGVLTEYESPFILTETGEQTGVYTVTVKDGFTDQQIIEFFTNYNLTYGMPGDAVATAEGNGGDLVLDVKEAGYYFVTTSTGSLVSITTADPAATVVDKSTTPGNLDKQIVKGEDLDNHFDHEEEDVHMDTEAIGDDVEFVVTADVPLYDGAYLITDYTFEDTMSTGLYIELGVNDVRAGTGNTAGNETDKYYLTNDLINIWVEIGSTSDSNVSYKLSDLVGNYYLELTGVTVIYDENGTTVVGYTATGFILYYETWDRDQYVADIADGKTIESAEDINTGNYPTDATIEIDYDAHVTEEAVYDNTNVIEMMWHQTPFNAPEPNNPLWGGSHKDKDDIYVLTLEVVKVDASTGEPLKGAEFELTGSNLHDVVVSTSVTYIPIETIENYEAEVAKGTILYFELTNGSYTTVNPYELDEDDESLNSYKITENAPDGYSYTAYTREVVSSTQVVESGETLKVTGTSGSDGIVDFTGLTVGDYTLTEVIAPDGYNLLGEDIDIHINWNEETGTFTCTNNADHLMNAVVLEDGILVITVEDQAGSILPSTGGIGTTIFYVIGIIIVAGAAILLVTRRRMNRAA